MTKKKKKKLYKKLYVEACRRKKIESDLLSILKSKSGYNDCIQRTKAFARLGGFNYALKNEHNGDLCETRYNSVFYHYRFGINAMPHYTCPFHGDMYNKESQRLVVSDQYEEYLKGILDFYGLKWEGSGKELSAPVLKENFSDFEHPVYWVQETPDEDIRFYGILSARKADEDDIDRTNEIFVSVETDDRHEIIENGYISLSEWKDLKETLEDWDWNISDGVGVS